MERAASDISDYVNFKDINIWLCAVFMVTASLVHSMVGVFIYYHLPTQSLVGRCSGRV